jgi:hypothetical protein
MNRECAPNMTEGMAPSERAGRLFSKVVQFGFQRFSHLVFIKAQAVPEAGIILAGFVKLYI